MTTTLGFMVVFNFPNSGKFNFSFFFDKQNKIRHWMKRRAVIPELEETSPDSVTAPHLRQYLGDQACAGKTLQGAAILD